MSTGVDAVPASNHSSYQTGVTPHGVKVYWYHHLQHVPQGTVGCVLGVWLCAVGHAYYIAHEFFDALPVHQFKVSP